MQNKYINQLPHEKVTCPFCYESGFDSVGLKLHLNRSCEKYENIDILSIKPFNFKKCKPKYTWTCEEHGTQYCSECRGK